MPVTRSSRGELFQSNPSQYISRGSSSTRGAQQKSRGAKAESNPQASESSARSDLPALEEGESTARPDPYIVSSEIIASARTEQGSTGTSKIQGFDPSTYEHLFRSQQPRGQEEPGGSHESPLQQLASLGKSLERQQLSVGRSATEARDYHLQSTLPTDQQRGSPQDLSRVEPRVAAEKPEATGVSTLQREEGRMETSKTKENPILQASGRIQQGSRAASSSRGTAEEEFQTGDESQEISTHGTDGEYGGDISHHAQIPGAKTREMRALEKQSRILNPKRILPKLQFPLLWEELQYIIDILLDTENTCKSIHGPHNNFSIILEDTVAKILCSIESEIVTKDFFKTIQDMKTKISVCHDNNKLMTERLGIMITRLDRLEESSGRNSTSSTENLQYVKVMKDEMKMLITLFEKIEKELAKLQKIQSVKPIQQISSDTTHNCNCNCTEKIEEIISILGIMKKGKYRDNAEIVEEECQCKEELAEILAEIKHNREYFNLEITCLTENIASKLEVINDNNNISNSVLQLKLESKLESELRVVNQTMNNKFHVLENTISNKFDLINNKLDILLQQVKITEPTGKDKVTYPTPTPGVANKV